ncbi:hypothetical protein Goklo_022673 [Gossypium klotzschianum]|uniref:Uncharacterized protein n=1 Tax=Gossypium klotzschianum TaxID=34286 RepID=A0A7J8TN43_9ROSI|nr:hypothetical protein [Gossypium klotzschianum]
MFYTSLEIALQLETFGTSSSLQISSLIFTLFLLMNGWQ